VTPADLAIVVLWTSVTAYAVLGGADFGAGLWDLLAGHRAEGEARRRLIEGAIGPVWEANHVWLVFVLLLLWTAFPRAVPPLMGTAYRPLTVVALGIILRGAGFALRSTLGSRLRLVLSATFAASSVVTPWFLGAFAGAIASGRVPGDPSTSWLHPTSLVGGTLAVCSCAYLAAIYLCGEADRRRDANLTADFRRRALTAGAACTAATIAGAVVLRVDAAHLFHGFTHRALPLSMLSAVAAVGSMALLWRRRYHAARASAGSAVAAVLWAWGVAQWPDVLPGQLTIQDASAATPTVTAVVVTAVVGGVILVPALGLLFTLKRRGILRAENDHDPLERTTRASIPA
jgi:cytochrome d ubiquinol oxidase subunit II